MQLRCLGSGSSGNCYLIENERECLVLEAGLPLKEVKKALDFNISKIVGVLISHIHNDHRKYAEEFIQSGIHVYSSWDTAHDILSTENTCNVCVRCGYWYKVGGFTVTPFECVHDVECYGFIIRHQDIGTLLFASDTEYIKQNFLKLQLNHIMVECNYSQKIIDSRFHQGETVKGLRDRVLQSHMELETCKEFIRQNKTVMLDNIILLHLSDGNSNEQQFIQEIQEVAGERVNVFVADKDLTVNIDIIPF